MSDESKSIVLPGFGGRPEIKELADRLQKMMPGGTNYTPSEALTLAQISVAHGLDPFNGEAWLIKDNDSGKVYGAIIGIKGMRKHAKKQANYWGFGGNGGFERIVQPDDMTQYGVQAGDIGFFYRIMDEQTAEAHIALAERMHKLGYSLADINKTLGAAPVTVGVGVWRQGEKTKMRPAHCAMFRAEKDALKRRFDILWSVSVEGHEIAVAPNGDEDEPDTDEIEAEYIDLEEDQADPEDKTEKIMQDLGYDPLPAKPKVDMVALLVENKLAQNEFAARAMIGLMQPPSADPDRVLAWARVYRGHRDSGKNTTHAADLTNQGVAP